MLTTSASGGTAKGLHARLTHPVCPRGGVLMLPLAADKPGDDWPPTMELKLGSQTLTGQVAWVHSAPRPFERHWTDDPRGLAIRAILPSDDTSILQDKGALGPYLLVRLPLDGQGELRLGKQALKPVWRDVPDIQSLQFGEDVQAFTDRPTLELAPSPDRPDPVSPFEYWRWVLMADALEMNPPRPFGGEIERLAAEYSAALWRIGMDRLSRQSRRIALQCRAMLIKTCIDRRQPFAAWIADPAQCGLLLSRLVDFSREDAAMLSEAVAWIDQQPSLFVWRESESGDQVRLNVMTPRDEPVLARFQWAGVDEPPIVVQIEPGVLTQVKIERPPMPQRVGIRLAEPFEPNPQFLRIQAAGQSSDVAFGPRTVIARPPGVFFQALSPPLTLAEVQASRQRVAAGERATFVQIRRLSGRWEVFFECRRPGAADAHAAPEQALPEELDSFDDLRGIEAVTLLLGPTDVEEGQPAVWLTVPQNGFHRVYRGVNDGTLQIHRQSHSDRWCCRIVLPESWFSAAHNAPALIGCLRSHADSGQIETGPNMTAPWRPSPSRAAIDLQHWDDLPQQE